MSAQAKSRRGEARRFCQEALSEAERLEVPEVAGFYEKALSEPERRDLPQARQMEGLDEEIAVMRVRLKRALEERPEDVQLIGKGLGLLVKAVAAKYRLSAKARKDLSDSIAGVVESIGAVLYPEGFAPDG